jgi:hypothetical protein
MGDNPYQRGYSGAPDPGFSGQEKMIYDSARRQHELDHQKRLDDEARMRAKAFSTGGKPGSLDGSLGDQRGAATEGGGAGLLAIGALAIILGVIAVGFVLIPLVLVMAVFAWPVPRLMRGLIRRDWQIGPWRSWFVMFLGLWTTITLAVLVGGACWYLGAATYHTGLLETAVLPLGGLVEMIRSNLVAGALPWTGLNHIAAGQWVMVAVTAGLPMIAAFAATLMRLERPTFNGVAGFIRAGGVGVVALFVGSVGLAASLTALGFTVVRLYG